MYNAKSLETVVLSWLKKWGPLGNKAHEPGPKDWFKTFKKKKN